MKKSNKVLKGIIISVIVLAIVAAGVLYALGVFGKSSTAATSSYQVASLTTGDLEKSVTGSGTLESGDTTTITAPADLTIKKVKVSVGQSVKKGDVLATVDTDALDTTISTLQSSISTADQTLQTLAKSEDDTQSLKSQVKGRVKEIIAAVGDDVKTVVSQSGGLFVISTDGKMKVNCKISRAPPWCRRAPQLP